MGGSLSHANLLFLLGSEAPFADDLKTMFCLWEKEMMLSMGVFMEKYH